MVQWRQDLAPTALPPGALLSRYEGAGRYADSFVATVSGLVSQEAYVEAFYTTALFKLERLALAILLGRPSTDRDVRRLAIGESTRFAAWSTEAREVDQILLCDFLGSSRSWLMRVADKASPPTTRLYFGTALVPREGASGLSLSFRALIPFHRLYARALLRSAVDRLERMTRAAAGP
ncbi:MAG: hypothetical protein JWM33_1157 [Caulobacteraceae bacterium]|nr:hypothetical protein [Caulobacteraceae bacterium]